MVTAVNTTYTGEPGSMLYLGKIAPPSEYPPAREGGTVTMLLSAFTGTGFQLLSTAPASPTYRPSTHGSGVWDNTHKTLWLFGSETHATDMDNAVYGWRASDGLFIKHYDADPKEDYRMDANGVYWSSTAKNRPWAMHTYQRMRFDHGTNEIEVLYDAHEHASVTPIFENPAHTIANRVPPIWYYNVLTGKWRNSNFVSSASMVKASYIYPVGFDASYGWFTSNGSTWSRLSPEGVYSTQSVSGKANSQYHAYMHVHNGTAYHVGGNDETYLYAKHPLANIPASVRFLKADYPALTGMTLKNMGSALMGDGRILFFPTSSTGTVIHAMILDPVSNTVTDTGHSISGANGTENYELACDWSDVDNCAILLFHRFDPDRIYAYRPE